MGNEEQVVAVKVEDNPVAVAKVKVAGKVKERVKVKEKAKEKAIPIHRAKAEKVKVKEKARERANPMAKVKERVKAKVNPMVKGVMLTKKAKIVPNLFPINSNKR